MICLFSCKPPWYFMQAYVKEINPLELYCIFIIAYKCMLLLHRLVFVKNHFDIFVLAA